MKPSPISTDRKSILLSTTPITGITLGLIVCIMVGWLAGCSSNTKDGKSGGSDGSQTKGKTGSETGSGSGDKKSYTQHILDLDPAKQKEYGVVIPKGAKALYTPRSVEDFVQSLTLFKRGPLDIAVYDTKNPNGFGSVVMKTNESNGVNYGYQVQYLGGLFIKQECWDTIYGPRQQLRTVNESTGTDRRFGGGRTVSMDHWSAPCGSERVLVRGYNPKAPEAVNAKKGEMLIEFVHFNPTFESICPGKGDDGGRRLSFHRFYKEK